MLSRALRKVSEKPKFAMPKDSDGFSSFVF